MNDTTLTKERIEAARAFFAEQLKGRLESDKELSAQDDPAGLVHPVYMGKLVEPYYRTIFALLDQHKTAPTDMETHNNMACVSVQKPAPTDEEER